MTQHALCQATARGRRLSAFYDHPAAAVRPTRQPSREPRGRLRLGDAQELRRDRPHPDPGPRPRRRHPPAAVRGPMTPRRVGVPTVAPTTARESRPAPQPTSDREGRLGAAWNRHVVGPSAVRRGRCVPGQPRRSRFFSTRPHGGLGDTVWITRPDIEEEQPAQCFPRILCHQGSCATKLDSFRPCAGRAGPADQAGPLSQNRTLVIAPSHTRML
jgi:hypothetical protein